MKYTLTASRLFYHPVPTGFCDYSAILSFSYAITAISETLSLLVVAGWHTFCSSLCAHTHTRTQLKRSYGKMLLRLGQVLCWLSLIWMVTQRFGLCVCVCCVFCVLALAHIQILPPLPSSLETTTTLLPSLPLLPCGRQCGRSLVAAHAHTPTCPPPPAHTTHQLFRDLGKASCLTYRTPTYYSPWGRKQAGNCISEGNKSQEM